MAMADPPQQSVGTQALRADHDLTTFACGVPSLDDWLRRRAWANQSNGASRTYVVTTGQHVSAYYALASGALACADAPGPIRRNMPDPIPVAVLGRLAVDRSRHGQGLGAAMLRDAVLRSQEAARILGLRGLLVHAIDIPAKLFYEHHGFTASATQPLMLVLALPRHF